MKPLNVCQAAAVLALMLPSACEVLATTPAGNSCVMLAGRGHISIQLTLPTPIACGTREAVSGHLEGRGLRPSDPVEFFDIDGNPVGFVQEYASADQWTVVHGNLEPGGWHVCFTPIRKGEGS